MTVNGFVLKRLTLALSPCSWSTTCLRATLGVLIEMMSVILPPGALRLALACIVVISHYAYLSGASLYAPIDGPAVVGFFFFSGYWVAQLWHTKYSRRSLPPTCHR
jgi:hypothetical protein